MKTLLRAQDGAPMLDYDETSDSCIYLNEGRRYRMRRPGPGNDYKFEEGTPAEIKSRQVGLNDRIFECFCYPR